MVHITLWDIDDALIDLLIWQIHKINFTQSTYNPFSTSNNSNNFITSDF